MGFVELYKKLKLKRNMKSIGPYVNLSPDSHYALNFEVQIRFPEPDYIFMETGSHCVLDGKYIFEKNSGSIKIGDRVHIGNSMIISIDSVVIDDDVTIAWDCLIYDHNSHSTNWEERKADTEQEYMDVQNGLNPIKNKNWSVVKSAPVHICSKAWIGTGAKILKGVTVGEGAIVAAGSVVTKDVEPWTMVGGNPATVLRRLKEE